MTQEEDPHKEKRAKILTDSLEKSNDPAWGYFGVGGSLAIGDNSYAPRMMRKPVDEDRGDPIRNIQAAVLKKGAGPDVYFSFEPPLACGDPYKEPERAGKIWMLDPDSKFKPPGKVKNGTNKLGYEYVEHKDGFRDPIAMKEKYGGDYMPPRNIYTGASKKGGGGVYTRGVLFGMDEERNMLPEHVPDDYDAPKKLRLKELAEHKAALGEAPGFKCMDYGNKGFSSNEESYKYDQPTHIPREPKPFLSNKFNHDAQFRPSAPTKKGILYGLIGGVPEYVEDPGPGPAKRKPKDEDAPPGFKLGASRAVCNPMPSVTTNMRNMRNERPSSFARPSL